MQEAVRVTEAVNYLIAAPNYTRLVNELTNMIEKWDTRPTAFAGRLALLNVLIDIGVDNRECFERLLVLIENKRKQVPITRRQDYQRELMRERRARMSRAVAIRERAQGPMTPKQRKLFEKKTHAEWMAERNRQVGMNLPWKERNAAVQAFWSELDMRLEEELYALRTKRSKEEPAYVQ